ncbi:hypothetical protein EGH21_03705 [Halomicroarcula sp. F13]|uniref:Uncharacterized protein n=1 Tax=Haloarcula rubra TaxID=2487747 RepID=A0AAW4PKS8_9EURY|nr:hypothetical protein [Halomicroarcula rubra]MBX0322133.1 hypothetical protein [Halomicroarcula rubra]
MSCESSNPPRREREPPASDASRGRVPTHNWRPTVVHGAVLWALLLGAALAVPAGHPLELGVAVAGVFVLPVLPVALCCDYRQARRAGTCGPGVAAYLANLARDVRTTLTRGDALGSERRAFDSC